MKNDEQLVLDYLNGDDRALPALINRHIKTIYNFVYRLSGNAEEAEDSTQETFVKMWKNLKKYRHGKNFKTWLFSIAHNAAIDSLRKRKTIAFSNFENEEGENAFTETLVDPEPLPDKVSEKTQDKQFLETRLAKLPHRYREVLILHYHEHLTFDEIGKILRSPLDTVKSQHRRALGMLRKLLVG